MEAEPESVSELWLQAGMWLMGQEAICQDTGPNVPRPEERGCHQKGWAMEGILQEGALEWNRGPRRSQWLWLE